ncbi:MAG: ferrochelatase [Caulobacterales bacterium]
MSERRVAIILFNLGGPDGPAAVRPFLFNLFNDPAIISAPFPLRTMIAALISSTREKTAQANYAFMGGGSPIVPETLKQAEALERALAARDLGIARKIFVAMRYWPPRAKDAVTYALEWGATEAVLLPLYPQYSTTTTASSLKEWAKESSLPASAICCYPSMPAFAQAHADAILQTWRDAGAPENPRVLFSAHGLPQRVVDAGDPYQWQVERSVAAVRALLPQDWGHRICYQSRVGPLKWLGPSTVEAIDEAGANGKGVIVSPIAFVSEHIETLVELDIEYAQHAGVKGLPFYLRAPALSDAPGFIETLADLAARAIATPGGLRSEADGRICPAQFSLCPHKASA